MNIAYLGPAGTWAEAAARAWGGNGPELLPLMSMGAVVSAVETGLAVHGVLPIENSLEGAVGTTLDLLIHETRLQIAAEVVVPIRHMLMAQPGTTLPDISVVRSHPQALAQCRRFLERVLPQAQTAGALSTTSAVAEMMQQPNTAAIATARAAELYGATILARDIQDKHTNATRFVVLAHDDANPTGSDRTSIAFAVPRNTPGSLVEVLNEFATAQINLSKLESRPDQERLGQYIFLCDLEGHRTEAHIAAVLQRIAKKADWFKVFGSYPRWQSEGATAAGDPALRT